jgi:RNA polymerase sigma factor (sigma-70 family)
MLWRRCESRNAEVKEIRRLITRATAAESSLPERQESFGEIVARFQDFAYGCAYAVLKDFWLAEDVAQEAFITAWQKLDQLRQPEAFPGWFRRIVLNECHRVTRGKKLQFVPLEPGFPTAREAVGRRPDLSNDPYALAEQRELADNVRAAIGALPEHERLITTLFYISEYSQKEIGAFLELPVSTVVKRLYSARQRLKKRMLEMFKDDLHQHRPSRDENFAEQVSARLRPYAGPDWEPISAFVYGLVPDFRQDEEAWLRNRQQFDETRYRRRQYVAEHAATGQILGYGSIEQTIFLPKYRLFLMTEPKWLQMGVGDLLLDQLMNDLAEAGAITVWHRNYAHVTEVLDFLVRRGFVETRRVWDMRLDLSAEELPYLAPIGESVAARGVTITTFAEERERDADEALHKMHEFLNLVKPDDPERQPFIPVPFESVVHWFGRKYVLADACFIAKRGDQYIGFTDLNHIEPIPGGIMHGFTGVAREHRRQGVATALKLRAIAYARQHGYRTIRAFGLPSQPEIMALNEKLGFRRAFCYVTVEKFVKQIAKTDPATFDAYVGKYVPDTDVLLKHGLPANLTITIRKAGDRLISELRDMQDELFPETESAFFTDHHYAQFVFARDESGAVTHLFYREDGREMRANKEKGSSP